MTIIITSKAALTPTIDQGCFELTKIVSPEVSSEPATILNRLLGPTIMPNFLPALFGHTFATEA